MIITIVLFALTFEACVFEELKNIQEKSERIQRIIMTNSECDEVSIMEYSVNNFVTSATYKLVGCNNEYIEDEGSKIMSALRDSIPDFCEIKKFNLVFVNKGKQQVLNYAECKLEKVE